MNNTKGSLLEAGVYFGLALAGGVVGVISGALGMKSLIDYAGYGDLLDYTANAILNNVTVECGDEDDSLVIDAEDYTISDVSDDDDDDDITRED